MIAFVGGVWVIQRFANRKMRRVIKLILNWYDYIANNTNNLDIKQARRLGDEVDEYLAQNEGVKRTMYFGSKIKRFLVNKFGINEDEDLEQAFSRLAHWEGDQVKLDAYWTIIRGSFAEYASKLEKGEETDIKTISAPVALIKEYWRV